MIFGKQEGTLYSANTALIKACDVVKLLLDVQSLRIICSLITSKIKLETQILFIEVMFALPVSNRLIFNLNNALDWILDKNNQRVVAFQNNYC